MPGRARVNVPVGLCGSLFTPGMSVLVVSLSAVQSCEHLNESDTLVVYGAWSPQRLSTSVINSDHFTGEVLAFVIVITELMLYMQN